MINNEDRKQLTVSGYLYAQVDLGLLMALGSIRVPTHITAYLLYCHLNSSRKPWFFAEPYSRPAFKVAGRTLRHWLSRMDEKGIITLFKKKERKVAQTPVQLSQRPALWISDWAWRCSGTASLIGPSRRGPQRRLFLNGASWSGTAFRYV